MVAFMFVAFTLRVYQLDGQSLWSDEGLSLYRARLSLGENLSNIIVVPPPPGVYEGPYAGVAAPPITSDPPEHHWHRRTILPAFSPQSVAKYEDGTRSLCHRLMT